MFSIKFDVERSITINQPVETVFKTVSDFNTWRIWSPWLCQEPECPVDISGAAGKTEHEQACGQQIPACHIVQAVFSSGNDARGVQDGRQEVGHQKGRYILVKSGEPGQSRGMEYQGETGQQQAKDGGVLGDHGPKIQGGRSRKGKGGAAVAHCIFGRALFRHRSPLQPPGGNPGAVGKPRRADFSGL